MNKSSSYYWKDLFRFTKPCECGSRNIIQVKINGDEQGPFCADCRTQTSPTTETDTYRTGTNRIPTPLSYFTATLLITATAIASWCLTDAVCCKPSLPPQTQVHHYENVRTEI